MEIIFAAVAGAQPMARSRADIGLYDALIDSTAWPVFSLRDS